MRKTELLAFLWSDKVERDRVRRKADRTKVALVAAPASGAHPAAAGFSGQPYHHSSPLVVTPCQLPIHLSSTFSQ